jgi:hypothetical protein
MIVPLGKICKNGRMCPADGADYGDRRKIWPGEGKKDGTPRRRVESNWAGIILVAITHY